MRKKQLEKLCPDSAPSEGITGDFYFLRLPRVFPALGRGVRSNGQKNTLRRGGVAIAQDVASELFLPDIRHWPSRADPAPQPETGRDVGGGGGEGPGARGGVIYALVLSDTRVMGRSCGRGRRTISLLQGDLGPSVPGGADELSVQAGVRVRPGVRVQAGVRVQLGVWVRAGVWVQPAAGRSRD